MSNKVIENLYYTKSDEWLKVEDDVGTIGITDYAHHFWYNIKAVSDVKTPVTGEVTESNVKVIEDASIINKDPYGKGWIAKTKIDNKDELKDLMSAQEYSEYRKE